LLGATYFCLVIGLYGIGFWMPQVIKTFGLSNLEIGFLTAIPYLVAAIGMVLAGRHSDQTGERVWHVALPLLMGACAFAWSAHAGPLPFVIFALSLATLGTHAALGTFWALPTAILTGAGAAGGLALINSIGNCGGFVGPLVVGWLKGASGSFDSALMFLGGALLLSGLLALVFGRLAQIPLGTGSRARR
jgi:ACS family tartrate transporter-like MFS transporter